MRCELMGTAINRELFINPTNFPYFSRLSEPRIVNLYVFSLVFALMGNLQGKSLFIALQPYPEVLQNFALLPSLRERKHSLWY